MPDEFGMNLAPNSASSMAVQLNEIKRMAAPYIPNCMADWSNTNLTSLSLRIPNIPFQ